MKPVSNRLALNDSTYLKRSVQRQKVEWSCQELGEGNGKFLVIVCSVPVLRDEMRPVGDGGDGS